MAAVQEESARMENHGERSCKRRKGDVAEDGDVDGSGDASEDALEAMALELEPGDEDLLAADVEDGARGITAVDAADEQEEEEQELELELAEEEQELEEEEVEEEEVEEVEEEEEEGPGEELEGADGEVEEEDDGSLFQTLGFLIFGSTIAAKDVR